MKIKFAPFGIGPTDMDLNTDVVKEKGKSAFFFALGCGVIVAEVALRYTSKGLRHSADAIIVSADKVDDVHDSVVDWAATNPNIDVKPKAMKLERLKNVG
jgi:hypothetical protein